MPADQHSYLSKGSARLVVLGCLALSCVVDTYTLRFLWWTSDLALGQYQSGYFEEVEGAPALVLDGRLHGSVVPDVGIGPEGSLSLPPGRSIGLRLAEGDELGIRVEDRDWAPHLLLGRQTRLPDEEHRHGGWRFVDGLRLLQGEAGDPRASPWQVVRAWRYDEADLRRLRERCAPENNAEMALRVASGIVRIAYGACRLQLALATADTLAVLSGPAWVGVRKGGGWETTRRWHAGWLGGIALASLLKSAAVVAALGRIFTLGTAVLVVGVLLRADEIVMLLVLLSFPSALAASLIRLWWSYGKPAALAFLCLGASVALFSTLASRKPPRRWMAEAPSSSCLLAGYSAIRGDGLRQDPESGVWVEHGGMWDVLRRDPACDGLRRYPRAAARFTDMRDLLCDPESPVEEGGRVLFWGGSNDDFLWGRAWDRGLAPVLRLTRYAYARPSASQWNELREAAEAASLDRLDEQTEVLEEALGCASRRRVRVFYVHDVLAWDLAGPRSAARQAMRARRREIVRREHSFEDIGDSLGDTAGVWMFNDYVHPSALGHRAIGEAILSASPGSLGSMR